ncbi:hypothetical protein C8R43DRAFT_1050599 [Mycena crocata]|nr:hypothetical protein C8R43DRAFT_1050599 [Mycena crocata]
MLDDTSLDPPFLPVDLEREIFEMAARSRPCSIPTLMLVASRVKAWVEPLLYRTIFIFHKYDLVAAGYPTLHCSGSLPHVIREKSITLLFTSVRNVYLSDVSGEEATWLLSTCLQIENLFMMGFRLEEHLTALAVIQLKRLCCSLAEIFPSISKIDFTHRLFAHLTHLWHFAHVGKTELWSGLALVPHFTHLAFSNPGFLPLYLGFLDVCKSLQVLVHLKLGGGSYETGGVTILQLAENHRFVSMNCMDYRPDWLIGAHTGIDFWSKAEDFVARRKAGQVPAGQYKLDG